jgi:hypothetical protein
MKMNNYDTIGEVHHSAAGLDFWNEILHDILARLEEREDESEEGENSEDEDHGGDEVTAAILERLCVDIGVEKCHVTRWKISNFILANPPSLSC